MGALAKAALLDEWKLEEWLELLTDDAIYQVPSTDAPEGDERNTLYLIADDALRIRSRVKQLLGKSAWAENPHSRTRRMITNVRVGPNLCFERLARRDRRAT